MKKTLNLIIKPLLILVIIAFAGCDKDLYEDSIKDSSKNITVSKISIDDLDKITSSKISSEISKFKNIRSESTSQGRFEYNSSLEIFIDTENGRLREIDGKEFYTFPMFKENETDLQNVLFEIKSDGSLQSYFIKYDVTPEEFNELSNEDILNLDSEYQKIMSADGSTEYICVELYSVETVYNQFELSEGNGNPSSSSSVATYVGSFCNWVEGGGGGAADGGGVGGNTSGGHSGGGATTGGSLYTGPVSLSPDLISMKDFVRDFLDDNQRPYYVNETQQAQDNIFDYLLENDFTYTSKQFIKNCIIKINQDPTDVLTSITPFLIAKKIDDSELNPCSKSVFQQIKNATVCDFVNIFSKLDADNSVYKTNLKTANNSFVDSNGNIQNVSDPANTIRTTPGIKYNYTVFINPDYPGKTRLYIASLLLHEIIHAYFFSLVDDFNMGANNSFNELPILFNAAVINHTPLNPELHHEEIANSYVYAIATALEEFQPGLPEQVYTDLAWSGLETTNIFNLMHPVGSSSRERILNRKAAEQTGNPVGQGTPNEQTPLGLPCN